MPRRSLPIRILRILAWIALSILTLVVVALGAVVLALNTDWGREKLRTTAEEQLGTLLNGTVKIGKITGSPLSHFKIASLSLASPDGRPELQTGEFELKWDPLALLHKTFRASEVTLNGPVIKAWKEPDGSLSLAHIMKPSDKPKDDTPSTFKVDLDKIIIRGGLFDLPYGPGDQTTLAALDMNGHLVMDGDTKDATLGILRAVWIQRGVPIQLRARAVATPEFATVANVEITAGGSRVGIPYALYGMKAGNLFAMLDAQLREADAFLFWPHDMVVGDVKLAGTVGRKDSEARIDANLRVDGLQGNVVANLSVNPDPLAARGEIHVKNVHVPGKLPAHGSLDATFDLTGKTVQTMNGKVSLSGTATVQGRTIDDLKVDATLEGGMARADLTVKGEGASVQAHADVKLGDEIAIEGARLRAEVPDLGKIAKGYAGHVAADVNVSGTPKSLAAKGQVTATGIVASSANVPNAKIDFDVRGLPSQLAGKVSLAASGVTAGGQIIGPVRVDASGSGRTVDVKVSAGNDKTAYAAKLDGRVTLAERMTRVAFGQIDLTAKGMRFQGKGGTVELYKNGAVKVDELELASNAGSFAVGGQLNAPREDVGRYRKVEPDGSLHIHLQDVDLEKMQATFAPDAQKISGTVSLDAHVTRDGKNLGVQGDLLARKISANTKAPPIDATMAVNLGEGVLVMTGHVRERTTGGVADLAFQSKAPKQTLDVNAWKSMKVEDALTGAMVQLRQMDIETLAKIGGMEGYSGRLDGTIVAEKGARALTWDVTAKNVQTPQFRNAALASKGSWDQKGLAAKADFELQGTKIVSVDAKVDRGLATLLDGKMGDVKTAHFSVDATSKDLPLETLRGALKQRVRLGGKLNLDAHVEGTVADPKGSAKVSLHDGRIAKVDFANLDVNATFDNAKIQATMNALQKQGGKIDLNALIDRQKQNAVDAQLKADKFDLGFIPALARSETDALAGVGGKLDADIKATVDQRGRTATGTIALNQGSFYVAQVGAITDITLHASLEGTKMILDTLKGKAGAGTIDGQAEAAMQGLVPQSFKMELNLNKVPVAAGSQTLEASLHGTLEGQSKDDPMTWRMTATLKNTVFKLPKTKKGGGSIQSTGKLEDVVYIDEKDLAQRQGLLLLTGQEEVNEGGQLDVVLRLVAEGGVQVTGQELDVLIKPDLRVIMRNGETAIAGSVEADHGYIELFGRRWDIDRANASFDPNGPPNPRIDVEIEHAFQTTTVYVDVTGTVQKPKLDLRADPGNYEQSAILGFVLGGDPDTPAAADQQPLQDRAVGAASGLLLGQVQSQLRDALPIDVLNFQIGDQESPTTTRVEVGKWVTDRLFVGYQARMNAPEDENVNEAEIKFRLGRRWLLDAFFGDRSVGGADVIWSKKY